MREAFSNPEVSILSIARKHGVSDDSLRKRVKGEIAPNAAPGWVQGLTAPEEEALVEFAIKMAKRGLGITRMELKEYVSFLVQNRKHHFGASGPSDKWLSAFLRRNPDLSLRVPEKLSYQRRQASSFERVSGFFEVLEEVCKKEKFRPELVWNADETSLQPNIKELKVIAERGSHVTSRGAEGGVSATLMVCISAAGEKLPPLYVFQGKNLVQGLLDEAPAGSTQAIQASGWMTQKIFLEFLKRSELIYYFYLYLSFLSPCPYISFS